MPQAVAGWIISATGVSATGLAAGLIQAGVGLAFNYAIASLTRPKGHQPKDNQIEMRQSDAPRIRYLGRNRVSGAVMYWHVHNRALWKLLAIAQGGNVGVVQWYAGAERITVSGGAVTSGAMAGKATLLWRKGFGDELAGGAYPELIAAAPAWTSAHRLDGVGTILARFSNVSAEEVQDVYPGGEPQITAAIEGDLVTNINTETFGHTSNLPRQLFDILTHADYGTISRDDMDLPSWSQATVDANDAVPTAGGTRPRYAGGGGYRLDEPLKDIAARWLEAMAGQVYLTAEGKVGLRVGKWRAPTHTITEDKIVAMEYGIGGDNLDGVARLVPRYTDPDLDYQTTTSAPWVDADAESRWGDTAARYLDLPVVQHHGQARALAKIKLAKLNPRWRFTMRLRFWGLLLIEEEAVNVSIPRLGITAQPFWIESFSFDPNGAAGVVTVTLISASPSSFNWQASDEGPAPAVPVTVDSTRAPLAAPTVTSVTVVSNDGPPYIRAAGQVVAGAVLVGQYRRTGTTDPWTHMVPEGFGGLLRTLSLEDASEYDIRVAAAPGIGQHQSAIRSEWVEVTGVDVIDNTTPPAAPVVLSASGTAGGAFTVTFSADLGVNYWRTRLYRGGPASSFGAAAVVATSYSTGDPITMTDTIPSGGARYWLQSENPSGVKSAEVLVGTYT